MRKAWLLAGTLILLNGCVEKEIIDDINIVSAFGYDLVEGGKVRGTAIIPVYKADKSISNESFTEVADISKETLGGMQKKSSDPLANGSLEMVLYNEKLAKKGLISLVDTLQRDASIGARVYMAVVEGEVKPMLESSLGNRGTGVYLTNLIEQNIYRRDLPQSNLHLFLYRYYARGMDPYLPYLKLAGDKVEIQGVALFQEDKMIRTLSNKKLFFFKLLADNYSQGAYTLKLKGKDEFANVQAINSKRKIKVNVSQNKPVSIDIHIDLNGHIREYSGNKLDGKTVKLIQRSLKSKIQKECASLISDFQKWGIDPIGFGEQASSYLRGFDFKEWHRNYPDLKINIHSNVEISETGVIE